MLLGDETLRKALGISFEEHINIIAEAGVYLTTYNFFRFKFFIATNINIV